MQTDRFSGQHSTASAAAIAAYEEAVGCVASHRAGAAEALASALAIAPDMAMAHALKGFGGVLLARAETFPPARHARALARNSLGSGGTAQERAFVAALGEAAEGRLLGASAILDQHLSLQPRDLVAIKLAHGLRFMAGDQPGMLATTGACLDAWMPDMPGYGFVLGCHAFGLEEAGDYASAERVGQLAVASEPRDVWGLHAVSHVYEMDGRTGEGIALLDNARPMWTQCHNFAFHMAWHLSLCHIARGRPDLALDIYDAEVRPAATDDFRDIANAVSLLWRLRQERADVGDRWHELEQIARRRTSDTSLVFASLHHVLTLVAVGDIAAARQVVEAIARRADGSCDQSAVAGGVGTELGEALLGLAAPARNDLMRLARELPLIGGSHAQRDVFLRSLVLIAADNGRGGEVQALIGLRRQFRRDDRFAALAQERLAQAQRTSELKFAS